MVSANKAFSRSRGIIKEDDKHFASFAEKVWTECSNKSVDEGQHTSLARISFPLVQSQDLSNY